MRTCAVGIHIEMVNREFYEGPDFASRGGCDWEALKVEDKDVGYGV